MEISKPHILVLASPGMGHLIPVLELAKRLVSLNTLHVTLFIVSTETSTSLAQLLKISSNFHLDLEIIDVTPGNISELVSINESVVHRLAIIMRQSLTGLRSAIKRMKSPPAALIVDIFGVDAFDLAAELSVPKYLFVTSTAWFVALTIYAPTLDEIVEGEYIDLTEPIPIPGCKPIRPSDVVDPMLNRKIQQYKEYLNLGTRMPMPDGLLLNSWEDLEPQSLKAFQEDDILRQIMKPRIYPIGPIVRNVGPEGIDNKCLDWLGKQPSESVLYVSFGSGGTLSSEQMTELAWGLELSQQRFIWMARPPTDSDTSGSFFNSNSTSTDPSVYLPEGFLTRTVGQGMVVTRWAPQEYILAHPSTGGFLSHCGWNSTLESIINGVPMIAWPLYSEQRMNAAMLEEELGVAVRAELLSSKVVSREEIDKMVRFLMESKEGKMLRNKVKDIKNGALKAIAKDGSSYTALLDVVRVWETNNKEEKM